MTNIFKDPIYDEMTSSEDRWLEAAMEPFHFEANEEARDFPTVSEFHYDDIMNILGDSNPNFYTITPDKLIKYAADNNNIKLSPTAVGVLCSISKVEIEVSSQTSLTTLNIKTKELSNPIKLTKIKDCLEDDEIKHYILNRTHRDILLRSSFSEGSAAISRANNLIDIFRHSRIDPNAFKQIRSGRSIRKKVAYIHSLVKDIIRNDEWCIRNADLVFKIAEWTNQYMNEEKIHAITNLTKLKCMTHRKSPIYSMEESV